MNAINKQPNGGKRRKKRTCGRLRANAVSALTLPAIFAFALIHTCGKRSANSFMAKQKGKNGKRVGGTRVERFAGYQLLERVSSSQRLTGCGTHAYTLTRTHTQAVDNPCNMEDRQQMAAIRRRKARRVQSARWRGDRWKLCAANECG